MLQITFGYHTITSSVFTDASNCFIINLYVLVKQIIDVQKVSSNVREKDSMGWFRLHSAEGEPVGIILAHDAPEVGKKVHG